ALVLEPIGDLYVRLYENLSAPPHISEVNVGNGVFEVTLYQGFDGYHYNRFPTVTPVVPYPNHLYKLPNVLLAEDYGLGAQEIGGEQRTGGEPYAGSGSQSDPFRILLGPKGVVRVTVRDAAGNAATNANVTIVSSGGEVIRTAADANGLVTVYAVPAGNLT